MSILNVNQIQPVGGGNTITVSASDISASGATITATSFVGSVTGTTSNASGATGDFSIADKIVHTGDTNTAIRFPAADTFTVETAGSERLRITSDGDLVMNGASPNHDTSSGSLFIKAPSGNPNRGIKWSETSDTHYVKLEPSVIDGLTINGYSGVAFATGSRTNSTWAERLRITSGGLIGIATDAPSSAWVDIATDSGSYEHLRLRRISSNPGVASNWSMKPYAGHLYFREGGSTDKIQFMNGGDINIMDGNLVLASGHGINFSATSDTSGMSSELLDDYEEGIHTVAFTASTSGSVTVSSGDDQISYVKIGNHVTVTGRPVITSVSSPQGNLRMTLPFTSSDLSDSAGRAACALNVRLLNSGYKVGMMSAYLDEGSNVLNFSYGDNNDSQSSAPAIKSGTQIWINISYRTV